MSDICNRIDGMVADEKRAIDEYTNFLPEIPHDDLSKKGKTIYGHNFYIAFSNLRDEKEEHLKTLDESYAKIERVLQEQKKEKFEKEFEKELHEKATIVFLD